MIANSKIFFYIQVHTSWTATPHTTGMTLLSKSPNLCISCPSKHVKFDLSPSKSFYKALFQGTELGEALKRISLFKAVPQGFKSVECECGIEGKNSPIQYILEQDPIQETLETKHHPMSFMLTLPSGSEMRMMRWASGTPEPEPFLIHVRGAIHAVKEM